MTNELTSVPAISPKVVETQIVSALNRAGIKYQQLLQSAENISFTRETINQDYAPLKQLREAITAIEKEHKAGKKPYKEAGDTWDAAKKSLTAPLTEILDRKTAEYTLLVNEIRLENERLQKEKLRIEGIHHTMNNVLLDFSQKISSATTDKQLLEIEKLINLECTRQNKYAELLDDFKTRAEPIRGLIKAQKQVVRVAEETRAKAEQAMQKGDDETYIALTEKQELLGLEMQENVQSVLETSLNQVLDAEPSVVVPEADTPIIKARRKLWKWRVDSIETLYRKRPDLVDLVPNKERIDAILNELKQDKKFMGSTVNGIEFYQEELF
jgi:hypothetical protein